jgi:hypothetical protein
MNNIILPILISIFSWFALHTEEVEVVCSDFKLGSYQIVMSGDSESYYSIERNEMTQIEINEYGDKVYYTIKWTSECSYIQTFDKHKMNLTDEMKMVNGDGGMVVELLEVKNDSCIAFMSYVRKFKKLSLRYGEFHRVKGLQNN